MIGNWWNSLRLLNFGVKRKNAIINGYPVQMELDIIGFDSDRISYYDTDDKFFEIQVKCYALNDVITSIARKFSNVNIYSKEKKSLLLDKLNNPNSKQSREEFLKEFAIYTLSCGWSVIWKNYKSIGFLDTLELINLNPDLIELKDNNIIAVYENKDITIPLSDVIIFYDTIRNNENEKGFSRIIPLKTQVDNIITAQFAKGIQMNNSGTTIVSPKANTNSNNIDEGLNAPIPLYDGGIRSQKQEIEEKLNTRGLSNRIVVASKGIDATNLSAELNTVNFFNVVESDLLAIYNTFSYPIELTPYGKNATFDNKEVAEAALIESEIIPLMSSLINSLNYEFNGNVLFDYNHLNSISKVKARIEDFNSVKLDNLKKAIDLGLDSKIALQELNKIYSNEK